MIRLFYTYIAIPFAVFCYGIAELFSLKLRKRREICSDLLDFYEQHPYTMTDGRRYWFHAASMGEFEQAKPVIEELKRRDPDCAVFVTFFSPSGYENQKNYSFADGIAYMPFDSPQNAARLLDIIQPTTAVFIRYDVWLNHLLECRKRRIPLYLLNASSPLKKFPAAYYRKVYSLFDKIFVMNRSDVEYFTDIIGNKRVTLLPDTRFDRIYNKVKANISQPLFDKKIFDSKPVLVLGSSWQPDEDLALAALQILKSKEIETALIIVPHEPTQEHVKELCAKIPNHILMSEMQNHQELYNSSKVIIADSIGKLLKIYANASIAYVGGAFGVGVHSVTEPAGYGIPVICGTGYQNSPDAVELVKLKALKPVADSKEFADYLEKLLSDKKFYDETAEIAGDYIRKNAGSTELFIKSIG